MKRTGVLAALALVATFLTAPAEAKIFRNTYVSFELPDRWDCHLEGTEWICNSLVREASREAIIILTAKEMGPADSLEAYDKHLRAPRRAPNQKGRPIPSIIKHVRRRNVGQHAWVDAMHLGSEIPGYYTRYLATVKDRLAILVTFSAHQRHFTKYSNDFFRAIESLQVQTSANALRDAPLAPVRPGTETLGTIPAPNMEGNQQFEEFPDEPEETPKSKFLAVLVLAGALAGYVFLKKKKPG